MRAQPTLHVTSKARGARVVRCVGCGVGKRMLFSVTPARGHERGQDRKWRRGASQPSSRKFSRSPNFSKPRFPKTGPVSYFFTPLNFWYIPLLKTVPRSPWEYGRVPSSPFVPSHGVSLDTMGQGTGTLSHCPWDLYHGTPWDKFFYFLYQRRSFSIKEPS